LIIGEAKEITVEEKIKDEIEVKLT